MDTTAAKHEAVHAHAQMLTLSLETFPDKHAGALHPGNLAGTGSNLVSALCSGLAGYGEEVLACPGGGQGEQEGEGEEHLLQVRASLQPRNPSSPPSLPPHPPLSLPS